MSDPSIDINQAIPHIRIATEVEFSESAVERARPDDRRGL